MISTTEILMMEEKDILKDMIKYLGINLMISFRLISLKIIMKKRVDEFVYNLYLDNFRYSEYYPATWYMDQENEHIRRYVNGVS